MFFFFPLQETAWLSLFCGWWAGGDQDVGKVLVGQAEGAESPPLLDPGGWPAKGRGSREGLEARAYVCQEVMELQS